MNKQQLLEQFMILIAEMQNIAVDIIDEKEYDDLGEFMDDIFNRLGNENETEGSDLSSIIQATVKNTIVGNVDRQRVMQEIGENQALMIFGEEVEPEEF